MARIKVKLTDGSEGTVEESQFDPQNMTKINDFTPKQQDATQYITGHSLQEHAQALNKAKAAGDSSAVKSITDDYERELQYQDKVGGLNKELSADEKKSQQAKQGVSKFVDELKSLYNVPSAQGNRPNETNKETLAKGEQGKPAAFANLAENFKVAMNEAPDAKTYKRLKEGFVASLKDITGDTGVLTENDAKRLLGILPEFGDTPESARKAWESVDRILQGEKGISTKYDYAAQSKPNQPVMTDDTGKPIVKQPIVSNKQNPPSNTSGGFINFLINAGKETLPADKRMVVDAITSEPGQQAFKTVNPRTGKVIERAQNKQLPTIDEAAGAAGEVAAGALPFAKGNTILKLATSGLIHGATTPNSTIEERAQKAVTEGAVGAGLGVAGKVIPKVINPSGAIGSMRDKAISEAGGKTISGDKIISYLEDNVKNVSPTQEKQYLKFLDTAREKFAGKNLDMQTAVNLNTQANQAYSAAGKVGKSSTATFNKTLGDALKNELGQVAPDIAKANSNFSKLYKAKRVGGKLILPASISASGLIISMALRQLLGQKGGNQ